MRAVVITKHGGPEVLRVQERPDPGLGAGDVRIEVSAAGINFADVMARMGLYPDAPKTPCVVGYEVAGTILELGEGASIPDHPLAPGQRVIAGTQFGGYASEVVVPAADVLPLADGLSFEQGAAIPVNYGTAWAGLIGYGNLQPGERVLVHSAGGGVGIAATQIAKHSGAEVYGTASPGKHARCLELGIDHALDYTTPGWERGLPKFDVILDAVGGKSFRTSYSLLRPGGRLVAFGASALVSGEKRNPVTALRGVIRMPRFNMIKQMSESKAVIGLNMLSLWKDRGSLQPWIGPLQAMLDAGVIKPVVAGVFHFEDAGAAQTMIVERRNLGKVVLTP
ncbi:MAG TPA: medium chain dehydrogenase/reductase family protein [Solirubrobacteraceae bacterium]|jgi:NADPH:quinone reductase-like Zn-dependent oxidoreductase|nr:medium chain dehydrogenase/reductase family protein [Solirubrobacteraceae bacterium]